MDGRRVNTHHICRLYQLLRCLGFSLRMDNLGPPLPLRLSLTGDGPLHLFIEVHLFCLHQGDLYSPGLCLFVQDVLEWINTRDYSIFSDKINVSRLSGEET